MYTLSVESHFDAAHRLSNYEGACSRLHGHRWVVKLEIESDTLNEWGAVLDFKEIKSLLDKELDLLDHRTILDTNDPENKKLALPEDWVVWFGGNPTAENLAYYLYMRLEFEIKKLGSKLKTLTVFETPTSYAEYSHEDKQSL